MEKIKVLGIILSPAHVILYQDDGTEITIKQGNIRDSQVIHDAVKDIENKGYAYIQLSSTEIAGEFGIYGQKGVARFFRVARKFITDLFSDGDNASEGRVVGKFPEPETEPEPKPETESPVLSQKEKKAKSKEKHKQAVADILGNKEEVLPPSTGVHLDTSKEDTESMTVAVVGDTVIPDAEALSQQIKYTNKKGDHTGMDNLLKRLAVIIHERQHSVEDLLKFLKKADLPIMDDGCILAYKRVRSTGNDKVCVDTHTGRVKQWAGCEVSMPAENVDTDRRNDCSHGLHVARRAYLRSFSGDTILYIKFAPEDVIAVPHYDHNKIRIAKYHILGKADDVAFKQLVANSPLTGTTTLNTISQFLAGNHIKVTDTVRILGEKGTDIEYTSVSQEEPTQSKPSEEVTPQAPLDAVSTEQDETEGNGETVSPKIAVRECEDVPLETPKPAPEEKPEPKCKRKASAPTGQKRKQKRAAKAKAKKEKPAKAMTPRDHITKILPVTTKEQAEECLMWKRKAKKGWAALGVPSDQEATIKNFLKK